MQSSPFRAGWRLAARSLSRPWLWSGQPRLPCASAAHVHRRQSSTKASRVHGDAPRPFSPQIPDLAATQRLWKDALINEGKHGTVRGFMYVLWYAHHHQLPVLDRFIANFIFHTLASNEATDEAVAVFERYFLGHSVIRSSSSPPANQTLLPSLAFAGHHPQLFPLDEQTFATLYKLLYTANRLDVADGLLQTMHQKQTDLRTSTLTYISALMLRNGRVLEARGFLDQIAQKELVLSTANLATLAETVIRSLREKRYQPSELYTLMRQLFQTIRSEQYLLDRPLLAAVREYFGLWSAAQDGAAWDVSNAFEIRADLTSCPNCSLPLETSRISKPDYAELKTELEHRIGAKYTKFREFWAKFGPFDAVVDGLNVAYSRHFLKYNPALIQPVVKELLVSKKRVLVVGGGQLKALRLPPRTCFYFVPEGEDDSIWILAALYSAMGGSNVFVVTNDQMRDHLRSMPRSSQEKFARWRQSSQLKYFVDVPLPRSDASGTRTVFPTASELTSSPVVFFQPPAHFTAAQEQTSPRAAWHFPVEAPRPPVAQKSPHIDLSQFAKEHVHRQWVCVQKRQL